MTPLPKHTAAFAAAAVAVATGCAPMPTFDPLPPTATPGASGGAVQADAIEGAIHAGVNQHRSASRLPPLAVDPTLTRLAREHSERMAAGDRPFGHDGFEERSTAAQTTLRVSRLSENVATNNYPPARVAGAVVQGWIGSPGHRRNMEGDYELTGVGVARAAGGDYFVTQLYAAR